MTETSISLKKIYFLLAILLLSVIFVIDVYFFEGPTRAILGVLFVGYFPGYSVMNVILIRDKNQNHLESFLFHVASSVVVVSFVALVLAASFIGFTLNSILFSLVFITDTFCIIGILRRRKQVKTDANH